MGNVRKIESIITIGDHSFDYRYFIKTSGLDLSVRSYNGIKNDNLFLVGDLIRFSEAEILRIPNLGRRSLNEIKEALAKIELNLGEEIMGWPDANDPLHGEIEKNALDIEQPYEVVGRETVSVNVFYDAAKVFEKVRTVTDLAKQTPSVADHLNTVAQELATAGLKEAFIASFKAMGIKITDGKLPETLEREITKFVQSALKQSRNEL